MRLTDAERAVMSGMYFRGDLSLRDLSQELAVPLHKVRYAFDQLRERGVIFPYCFINPGAVGITEYQVFLALAKHQSGLRRQFIEMLKDCEEVTYLGGVGGPYEFDLLVWAHSMQEVAGFLDSLSQRLKGVEFQKTIAGQIGMTYFPPKYLGCRQPGPPALSYGPVAEAAGIDELDCAVLCALVSAAGLPHSEQARRLKLAASPFNHRVEQLKSKGVIAAFGYQIDPFALGLSPHIFLIELSRSGGGLRARLADFAEQHPNASYLIENLGGWDYQLGARFEDARQVAEFSDLLHRQFEGALARVTHVPVYERYKLDSFPLKRFARLRPAAGR